MINVHANVASIWIRVLGDVVQLTKLIPMLRGVVNVIMDSSGMKIHLTASARKIRLKITACVFAKWASKWSGASVFVQSMKFSRIVDASVSRALSGNL
jgi:hypothetical protein